MTAVAAVAAAVSAIVVAVHVRKSTQIRKRQTKNTHQSLVPKRLHLLRRVVVHVRDVEMCAYIRARHGALVLVLQLCLDCGLKLHLKLRLRRQHLIWALRLPRLRLRLRLSRQRTGRAHRVGRCRGASGRRSVSVVRRRGSIAGSVVRGGHIIIMRIGHTPVDRHVVQVLPASRSSSLRLLSLLSLQLGLRLG